MFRVEDWLRLHGWAVDWVFDTISHCFKVLDAEPKPSRDGAVPRGHQQAFGLATRNDAYERIVFPALIEYFTPDENVRDFLERVAFTIDPPESEARPRTIDRGPETPLIVMPWTGQAAGLLTLAHEVGHALQLSLSAGSFMPPVAREACAFLSERIVLDWLKPRDPVLFHEVLDVWQDDQAAYLGDDLAVLAEAMGDISRPYKYRLNYPLAHLAAQCLYPALVPNQTIALFASGARGAAWITRELGWGETEPKAPPLPPLPNPGATPVQAAYASLGAMVALDFEDWQLEADQSIGTYYGSRLKAIQLGTAFVGLDDEERPYGTAIWSDEGGIHLATPFGQRERFRTHLAAHRAPEAVTS